MKYWTLVIFLAFALFVIGCGYSVRMNSNFEPKETFKYSSDIMINYEVYGEGEIPIVFLHGFGASLHSWDDIKPYFSSKLYKLYLLDLKGFGFSSKPKDKKYTVNEQAEIVIKFLKENSIKDAVIIGHSYGGAVSLVTQIKNYENKDYDLISKLVLIDCGAYTDDIPYFIGQLKTPIFNTLMFLFTSANFRARHILKSVMFDEENVTDERIERYAKFFREKNSNYVMVKSARQVIPDDFDSVINKYKSIDVPTLIIWGKNDPIIPVRNGERLNNDITNSRLIVLDKCGHIPHEELPKKTFDVIKKFLNVE